MKAAMILLSSLSLCLCLTTLSHAAGGKPHTVAGTVAKVEGGMITVQLKKDAGEKVFETNDATEYEIEGKEGTLGDLKEGMAITVQNQATLAVKVTATAEKKGGKKKPKGDKGKGDGEGDKGAD